MKFRKHSRARKLFHFHDAFVEKTLVGSCAVSLERENPIFKVNWQKFYFHNQLNHKFFSSFRLIYKISYFLLSPSENNCFALVKPFNFNLFVRSLVFHIFASISSTAIRSGDYYMFEDVEDEFELDIINQRDSDDEEEKKSATRKRLSKKMNFSQVTAV